MSVFIDNASKVTTIIILSATGIFLLLDAYKTASLRDKYSSLNKRKDWASVNGDVGISKEIVFLLQYFKTPEKHVVPFSQYYSLPGDKKVTEYAT